jgi:hypothetical protein
MDTSAGAVLPLDLSKLDSFSLFPGQIVGVECTNPNGSRIQVTFFYALNVLIRLIQSSNIDLGGYFVLVNKV